MKNSESEKSSEKTVMVSAYENTNKRETTKEHQLQQIPRKAKKRKKEKMYTVILCQILSKKNGEIRVNHVSKMCWYMKRMRTRMRMMMGNLQWAGDAKMNSPRSTQYESFDFIIEYMGDRGFLRKASFLVSEDPVKRSRPEIEVRTKAIFANIQQIPLQKRNKW
ncbi:hypothetical protein G9A89_013899 [Geosiphon pyriformis]|nr:hypothetical protein G9A89_013899 [Geosiphon pyriformis]